MRVPDDWQMVKYPGDYIGSDKVTYSKGTPAVIKSSDTEYAGDGLLFHASLFNSDSTNLRPQWQSPQDGLTESEEDFTIGNLPGKRFKAVFTGASDQIIYEYEFNVAGGKHLSILYMIYPHEGGSDDVATVEKAIKTITF